MGFADQDGDNPDANPLDRYGKHGCINPGGAVHYGNCSIVASCLNGIEPISLRNGNGNNCDRLWLLHPHHSGSRQFLMQTLFRYSIGSKIWRSHADLRENFDW